MSNIENLKSYDPFAEADEDTGEAPQKKQEYIHIRIQQRNGRKTLTTVQGLPTKFDNKKILKVVKKKFACNGTIVTDPEMGEVIQLQGDQRKSIQEFLVDKDAGLELDPQTIKVRYKHHISALPTTPLAGGCRPLAPLAGCPARHQSLPRSAAPSIISHAVHLQHASANHLVLPQIHGF